MKFLKKLLRSIEKRTDLYYLYYKYCDIFSKNKDIIPHAFVRVYNENKTIKMSLETMYRGGDSKGCIRLSFRF